MVKATRAQGDGHDGLLITYAAEWEQHRYPPPEVTTPFSASLLSPQQNTPRSTGKGVMLAGRQAGCLLETDGNG